MEILGVTGHRPHKLHGYSKDAFDVLSLFMRRYFRKRKDVAHVNIGMAMGFDMACARACSSLDIPYTAYIPYKSQPDTWSPYWQDLWKKYCDTASKQVLCFTPRQLVQLSTNKKVATSRALDLRNHRIVDNSTELLSLYSGASGGTKNCIDYALRTRTKHTDVYASYVKFANLRIG